MALDATWSLAVVINALRPDWAIKDVQDMLVDSRGKGTPAEMIVAAALAASTPSNRTHKIIKMDGPHWRTARALLNQPAPRQASGPICQICGMDRQWCEERWSADHAFESIDDARRRRAPAESKIHQH